MCVCHMYIHMYNYAYAHVSGRQRKEREGEGERRIPSAGFLPDHSLLTNWVELDWVASHFHVPDSSFIKPWIGMGSTYKAIVRTK